MNTSNQTLTSQLNQCKNYCGTKNHNNKITKGEKNYGKKTNGNKNNHNN